jgi:hypothetical protein
MVVNTRSVRSMFESLKNVSKEIFINKVDLRIATMKVHKNNVSMNLEQLACVVKCLPSVIDTIIWQFLVVCEKCSHNLATEICPVCEDPVYCQLCEELWLKEEHCRRIALCPHGDMYYRMELVIHLPPMHTSEQPIHHQIKNKNKNSSRSFRHNRGMSWKR